MTRAGCLTRALVAEKDPAGSSLTAPQSLPFPYVLAPQTVNGKSKYGVPIFLPNGNVNPAYLAAERKEMAAVKAKNMKAVEAKRKGLIGKGAFELADYIKKAVGEVGSGKEYYQSGR